MVEIHFATPRKPYDDTPANTNKQWTPLVSKRCRNSSIRSMSANLLTFTNIVDLEEACWTLGLLLSPFHPQCVEFGTPQRKYLFGEGGSNFATWEITLHGFARLSWVRSTLFPARQPAQLVWGAALEWWEANVRVGESKGLPRRETLPEKLIPKQEPDLTSVFQKSLH